MMECWAGVRVRGCEGVRESSLRAAPSPRPSPPMGAREKTGGGVKGSSGEDGTGSCGGAGLGKAVCQAALR